MSNLYIFKVDNKGNISRSRNVYNIEGKNHESGRIFSASEYVNFLNNERPEKFFLSYSNDDFFEKINERKPKKKSINDNKLVRVDLKFEEFKLENKYRIIRKSRFEDTISKSKWSSKEDIKKGLEVIRKENKKRSRNPYVTIVENALSLYQYVYHKDDTIDEREYLLEEKRKEELTKKTINVSKEVDKKFNAEVIKKDFLLHVLNKISVIDNFKVINNDNVCLIRTIIPIYDKNKLSIREQEKLIKRVFPSINFNNDVFSNNELLNGNPHINLIKKHKHAIIMSVLEKSSILGINPVSLHYSALDKALTNHKLDIIESNKLKIFLDKLLIKVKKQKEPLEQINASPIEIVSFLDTVTRRVLGVKKGNPTNKK